MQRRARDLSRSCPGQGALRRGVSGLVAGALLATAAPASANGRYPAAGLISVHPNDPSRMLVRATYGVLTTQDGGERWHWICEPAVGFGGFEDPMISFLADGTLIAGVFKGLSVSKSGGCDWSFSPDALAERYVTDLSPERVDPSRAVLVISTGIEGRIQTQLWETSDNGDRWSQAGADLPEDFLALTLDAAPSDPARVYISGRFGGPEYPGALMRTSDRGLTWERLDVPGSDDTNLPYIGAIDPADPDTLYVRLDGDPVDTLLVSHDGGQSFTSVFESQGNLLGFALSPDGATVLLGGPVDGVLRAPASTLEFEKVSDVGVRCLTWVDAGLFACGDEVRDGFTVGVSHDQGESFSALLHLDGLCGPLECAPGSEMELVCNDLWGATEVTIGSRQCGGSAGAGGSEGTGGGGPPDEDPGGCGCKIGAAGAEATGVGGAGWFLLSAAIGLACVGRRGLGRRPSSGRRNGGRGPSARRKLERGPSPGRREGGLGPSGRLGRSPRSV